MKNHIRLSHSESTVEGSQAWCQLFFERHCTLLKEEDNNNLYFTLFAEESGQDDKLANVFFCSFCAFRLTRKDLVIKHAIEMHAESLQA